MKFNTHAEPVMVGWVVIYEPCVRYPRSTSEYENPVNQIIFEEARQEYSLNPIKFTGTQQEYPVIFKKSTRNSQSIKKYLVKIHCHKRQSLIVVIYTCSKLCKQNISMAGNLGAERRHHIPSDTEASSCIGKYTMIQNSNINRRKNQ